LLHHPLPFSVNTQHQLRVYGYIKTSHRAMASSSTPVALQDASLYFIYLFIEVLILSFLFFFFFFIFFYRFYRILPFFFLLLIINNNSLGAALQSTRGSGMLKEE
jgi:hypothetical protein